MKLYKITSPHHVFADSTIDNNHVTEETVKWAGSQTDARKTRMSMEEQFKDIKPAKRPRVEVEEVDVPTDKQGLIAFLNA